jgi:hypothetical protein
MNRVALERGQVSVDYLGVLVALAALVAVLVASFPKIGELISSGVEAQVCKIARGDCGAIDATGDGTPDGRLIDLDGDGLPDAVDVNGDGAPDGEPLDTDGDGAYDAIDVDGDGGPDGVDLDGDGSFDGVDVNGDGLPDGVAVDVDGDGVSDGVDINGDGQPDGIDINGDGVSDVALSDLDGDGLSDAIDGDEDGKADGTLADLDGDGRTDGLLVRSEEGNNFVLLLDDDGDGSFDGIDSDGDGDVDVALDKDGGGGGIGGLFHGVLDVAGVVPLIGEVADLVNAGWYALEGDMLNAGLSVAGAIPLVGWGATGTKYALKYGDEVVGALKSSDEVVAATRFGDEALDVARRSNFPESALTHPDFATDVTGRVATRSNAADILRENMHRRGLQQQPGTTPHHIVPFSAGTSPNAAPALREAAQTRSKLQSLGVDVNSAANGAYLPRCAADCVSVPGMPHQTLHTHTYYQEVNRRLADVQTRGEAVEVLDEIRQELLDGSFPR